MKKDEFNKWDTILALTLVLALAIGFIVAGFVIMTM